jgi:hypothetical protein
LSDHQMQQCPTACWRVVSLQLRSDGPSCQYAAVGASSARWNDRQKDIAELASAPQRSQAGWLMASEGDGDLGFVADDGFAGDVVGHAVEGAGERAGVYSSVTGGASARR